MKDNHIKKFPALIALLLGLSLFPLLFQPAPVQAAEAYTTLPDKVVLPDFPVFAQQHNLSCEYASARIITAFWQQEIGEEEFINAIPLNANPHLGFRGNINAWFGGTTNYGIYLEPISRYLETRGFSTRLLGGGVDDLKAELAKGRPVQVIVIAGMGWSSPFRAESDGLTFQLAPGEHSVVVYGYDAYGVYVSDPASGSQDFYSWGSFLRSWGYLSNMGMGVWKQDTDLAALSEPNPGISSYFYRHWLNNGAVPIFGKPVTAPQTFGSTIIQYFERSRLEYNLNGPLTQPVMAGLLGRELTVMRQEAAFQPVNPSTDPHALYFEPTGHNLNNGFRGFWEQYGGLWVFGFPISEEFVENGQVVQYFERARFEYFAENPEPYKVLLGLLGVERLKANFPFKAV